MSIANEVVDDDKINWHDARAIGLAYITKMTGQTFNNIKSKRADGVLSLLSANSVMIVLDKKVPIDTVLSFQRISITNNKTFEDEFNEFFEYVLAPHPL